MVQPTILCSCPIFDEANNIDDHDEDSNDHIDDHDEDDDLRQLGDLGPAQLPVTMLLCPVGAGNEEGGHPPGRSCLKP